MNLAEYLTTVIGKGCEKSVPKGKASGIGVITAEVLVIGGNHVLSVMLPLYRVVFRFGIIPEVRNKAALNTIREDKGSNQGICAYRPIALAVLFRRILKKILNPRIEGLILPLDVA